MEIFFITSPVSVAKGGGGKRQLPGGGTGNKGAGGRAVADPALNIGGGWQYLAVGVGNSALGCKIEAESKSHGVSSFLTGDIVEEDWGKEDGHESCRTFKLGGAGGGTLELVTENIFGLQKSPLICIHLLLFINLTTFSTFISFLKQKSHI